MSCIINEIIELVEWAAEECANENKEKGARIYNIAIRIYNKRIPNYNFDEHFHFQNLIKLKRMCNKYK